MVDSSIAALLVLAAVVVLFVTELVPVSVAAVSGALAMGVLGLIPFQDAFSGFSNDVTMMLLGGTIVGTTLFETGMAQLLGDSMIRLIGLNERRFLVACVVVSGLLSAFLSNTAVVAMMLPVVDTIAAGSGGTIRRKNVYMAIGFSANIGGGMTLAGSPPNAIGQGLLMNAGAESMGVFDLTWASIPRFLFVVGFYAAVGYRLQNKVFDFRETGVPSEERCEPPGERGGSRAKMLLSGVILAGMTAGFALQTWTVGATALFAGLACIWTGCIRVKQVFTQMDWSAVWTLAGSLGIAAGIDRSGAGKLIADTAVGWLGDSVSLLTLMALFSVLSVAMGNLMSSSPSMAILGPIAINICGELGYAPKPVIMAIIWSLNLAFLSPIATPPVTMTMQCGYRFSDYAKVGSVLLAGCLALTILCYPFIL